MSEQSESIHDIISDCPELYTKIEADEANLSEFESLKTEDEWEYIICAIEVMDDPMPYTITYLVGQESYYVVRYYASGEYDYVDKKWNDTIDFFSQD